jgi:hypothetical protein
MGAVRSTLLTSGVVPNDGELLYEIPGVKVGVPNIPEGISFQGLVIKYISNVPSVVPRIVTVFAKSFKVALDIFELVSPPGRSDKSKRMYTFHALQ